MDQLIDMNVRYAMARGLVLTAVKPRGKYWIDCEPLENYDDWEDAKHRHGADINPAIHLNPSNLCVFDFDEPDGFKRFSNLCHIPDTAMVQTRRGVHLFFERPNELDVGTTGTIELPDGRMVGDYLCGNTLFHYTMLPGAIHPSGYRYQWLRPPQHGFAMLPLSMRMALVRDDEAIGYEECFDD